MVTICILVFSPLSEFPLTDKDCSWALVTLTPCVGGTDVCALSMHSRFESVVSRLRGRMCGFRVECWSQLTGALSWLYLFLVWLLASLPLFIDLWSMDSSRIYVIVLWTRKMTCPNHTVGALIVGELEFRFPLWFTHATVLIWRSEDNLRESSLSTMSVFGLNLGSQS